MFFISELWVTSNRQLNKVPLDSSYLNTIKTNTFHSPSVIQVFNGSTGGWNHRGENMTEVIIQNSPEDYFDVLNTDNFSLKGGRELNWLEISNRNKNQIHSKDVLHPINKVPPFRKILEKVSDEEK